MSTLSFPAASRRRWQRLLVPVLVAAACSPSDETQVSDTPTPAAQPAGAIDPCTLVTGAEATAALGATAGAPERPTEANIENLSTCRYVAPRGQGVAVLAVMVYGSDVSKMAFESAKAQPFTNEPVTGVGDEAFWIGDPLHTLYVLKGGRYVSFGGDVSRDQAKALATTAIQRLP
jgi:hypothetical protein